MGAVVRRYIQSVLLCLSLFSWGSVYGQSVTYSPNQSVYCGATGQIEFSLDYTPVDSNKVYWSTNNTSVLFNPGIGAVDTLTWSGISSPQVVSIFVTDSSASPIYIDTTTLNIAPFPNPSIIMGSSFAKCSGNKTVSLSPPGGQLYLDDQLVSLDSNSQLDINSLDVGSHKLRYEVNVGGCSNEFTKNFNIIGFVFAPSSSLSANVRFRDVSVSPPSSMLGTIYQGQLLFKKCSSVSGNAFLIDLLNAFSQYDSVSVSWGDGGSTNQSLSSSSPLNHAYTQAGMYDVSLSLSSVQGCSLDTTFKVFFGTNPNLSVGIKNNNSCITPGFDSLMVTAIEILNYSSVLKGSIYRIYSQVGGDTIELEAPLVTNGQVNYPGYLTLEDSLMYSHPFRVGSCGIQTSNGKSNIHEITVELITPCAASSISLSPFPVSVAASPSISSISSGCVNDEMIFEADISSGSLVELSGVNTFSCNTNNVGVWTILSDTDTTILPNSGFYTLIRPNGDTSILGDTFNDEPPFWDYGDSTIYVTFKKPGIYKIVRVASMATWTSSSAVPCGINYDTLEVCIDEVPIAEFTSGSIDSICALDTISVSLLEDSINCSNLTTYKLELYKGSTLIQTFLDSETTYSASFNAPSEYGEYYIKGTVSNECGDSSIVDTFYVFEPVEVVPIESSSTYCRDSVVLEIGENLFYVNTDSSDAYLDSVFISPSSGWEILGTGEYRFNSYGTYDVKAFYQGFCNVDSAEHQLILNAPPVATFSLSDSSGCSPFSPAVSLLVNNSNYTHSWFVRNTNGVVVDSAFNSIPTFTFSNTSNTADSTFTITHYVFDGTSSCLDTAEINITVHPNPSAGFSLPSTVCAGSTVSVNDTSKGNGLDYRWLSSGGVVISDTAADEPTLFFPDNQAPNADTTYTITLIITSEDGCKDTAVQNVVIHARPLADFGIDSVQCGSYVGLLNDSSQFNGPGPLTYSWGVVPSVSSAGGATLSSATAASPTLTIPAPSIDSVTYRITLTVTDSYGCTDEHLDSIKVYARPTSLFTVSDVDTCGPYDLVGKITDASTNGFSSNTTAGLERRWLLERDNAVLHDSIGTELDYTLTNTGVDDSVYTITLMVANERGCMDTSSVDVTIYPDARAEVDSLVSLTQCAPFVIDSTVLKAVDYSNANGTYTWTVLGSSMAPMTGASGLNFTINQGDTSIVIRLIVSSKEGCNADTVDIIVTTIPNPDASFVINDTLGCALYTPLVISISAPSNITHEWNIIDSSATGNLVLQTATTYQPTFTGLGNPSATAIKEYWVQHIVTAGSGCTDTAFLPVYVYPDPAAGFSLPSTVCAGSTVSVNDTSQGNGLDYRWLSSGGVVISDTAADEPTLFFPDNQAPNADTTYTITLIITSEDGCKDTAVQNVVIHARPLADFGIDSVQCGSYVGLLNDSSQFNGPGPLTYSWGVVPSVSSAGGATLSSATAASPTLTIPAPSIDSVTYRITLTVTDSYGCTDEHLDSIKVYARPTSLFTVSDVDTCGPYDLVGKITDASTNGFSSNTTAGLERRWLVERDNVLLHDSIGTQLDYTLTNTGVDDSVYTITLMVTNERGCMDTSSVDVTIYPDALAKVDSLVTLTQCAPFLVDSTVLKAVDYPNANGTYTWTVLDGSLTTFNGRVGLNYLLSSPDSSLTIRLVVESDHGCESDTVEVQVTTIPNPDASFVINDTLGCALYTPLVISISAPSNITHEWNIIDSSATGNLVLQTATTYQPTFTGLGNPSATAIKEYWVQHIVTAGSGCTDTAFLPVYVYPDPAAGFSLPSTVCAGSTVSVNDTSQGNGLDYRWLSSGGVVISDTAADEPTLFFPDNQAPNADTTYTITLIITSEDGCKDTAVQNVVIHARPLADFGIDSVQCGSYVGLLNDSSQFNGPGPLTYSWGVVPSVSSAGGATLSSATAASPTLTIPAPSIDSVTYRITLTVTDSYGCTDEHLDSIKVYARPTSLFTVSDVDTCGPYDLVGKITDASTNGFSSNTTAGLERRWLVERDNVLLHDSVGTTLDYALTNTGVDDSVYTITLMVTNGRGCMDTSSVDVTIYPNSRAELVANSSLYSCAPFIVDSSVVSVIDYPNANDTYTWNAYDSLSGTLVYGPVSGINNLSFSLPIADSTVLIVLSTSNANGCGDDADTITVGTLPNPDASFTFDQDTVCSGDSIYMSLTNGNAQTTYDWFIDSTGNGMQFISSGTSSFISELKNDGDTAFQQMLIKCVATIGSTGCSDSITLPISVRPNPTPSFTQNLVCGLDTVELIGNTAKNSLIQSWNWVLGTSLLTGQNVYTYYGSAGYYSGILATTTYAGCMRQIVDSIVVYDYPTANYTMNTLCAPDTTCVGETIVFNDSSQTPGVLQGMVNSWGWDINNDGSIESNLQNYNTSLNGFGYVDVELMVTNQYGCADSVVKSPFIQVEPQAEISFSLDTTCAPWQTSFAVQDTGYIDSTYYILRALDGGGTGSIVIGQGQVIDSVIKDLQPNYYTDSIFTIEHTVWNCCGSSTDLDSVYLKTPPVADYAVVPDTGCTPFTTTFVLQNKVRGNASYAVLDYGNGQIDTIIPQLINSPNGFISVWPNQTATYTYSGVADTTYQSALSVFNDCGDSTYSRFIHVLPNNVVALIDAPSTEGCAPFTVDFENLTTGATNYSWCFDWDGSTCASGGSNSFEPSWTYANPGTYEVAMFADNGCGYDTAYLEIIVNPSPSSSFTTNAPICANDTLVLLSTSTVSTGFITVNDWTIDSLANYQTQDVNHVISAGGSYGVSLLVESDNGCADSSYQLVTINHNPKVNFSFQNACLNEQPVQFFDSTSIQGTTINYTYWDFGDGNGSIALNPSHSYAQPGTYQVKLIKGSTQGCLDSMIQTITIYDIPQSKFKAVLTSGDSCSVPQTYEFQNLTTGAQAYLWDFDYLNSPGQFTSAQTTPSFTYTSAGVYEVRLISFNAFGCTDTVFRTVVVNDGVVADFDVSPVNGCDPLTLNLLSQPIFNRQLDTILQVRWELSNGWAYTTSDSISLVTIDQPGQYELNYYVYTNQGCSDSIIGQIINVYPTPEPNFTISKVDIRTFDFINNGVYLDTTLQFLWSFGDGDTSNAFSPRHRYLQSTMMDSLQVCLIVRNGFNCFESICKPIFLWDYNLSVPNSIVPERTQFGEDALFLPKGHDLMDYTLSIFDKWGNLVFESSELQDGAPAEAWNGSLNNQGEILPMGAYVWKIEATFNDGHVWQGNSYSGEKPKRYGTLMLIR